MAKDVFSVSEVNNYISGMFETDFMLGNITISGEISNITYHGSGHIYFTLKDEDSTIAGVMFRGSRATGLTFPMKTGDKVLVTGRVGVYKASGRYQIYATKFQQAGIGDLYQKFEELKKQFQEMGMFDESYKRPIPKYATKIGIVTAETGAAIHDIITTSTRRNPHVQLFLYPSLVQGDGAAASIADGIQALDELDLDLLIVGRGGGSIEDLWAFNEEEVARAIFACDTPIISAVGHEPDFTIADYVADLRAATPTAAAELAVFEYDKFLEELAGYKNSLDYTFTRKLEQTQNKYELLKNKLAALSPDSVLREYQMRLADLSKRVQDSMEAKLKDVRHELEIYANRLDGLSPAKKLSSGYSYVVNKDGANVTSATDLAVGDDMKIYMSQGTVQAQVTKIEE